MLLFIFFPSKYKVIELSIVLEEPGQIKLKISNITCHAIQISDPKYWGCSFLDEMIKIDSGDTYEIYFSYSVEKILPQQKLGITYSMYMEYCGKIDGERLDPPIKSNVIEFIH